MRFLRHLSAVVLMVAVIVGLGMLWAHASGGGRPQAPPGAVLSRVRAVKGGVIRVGPGVDYHASGIHLTGFQLANSSNLIQTCVIEAVLAAVVITVSAVRRRHRRARRAATRT